MAIRRLHPGVKLLAAGCRYQRSTCFMLGFSDLWPYTNCVAKYEYVGSFAQSLRHSPAKSALWIFPISLRLQNSHDFHPMAFPDIRKPTNCWQLSLTCKRTVKYEDIFRLATSPSPLRTYTVAPATITTSSLYI